MEKEELRKEAKKIRRVSDISGISRCICGRISEMAEFLKAKEVLLYYPKSEEIDLLSLCDGNKNFYLPRVDDKKLLVCPYTCGIKLEKSEFGVLEPCSSPISPKQIDFAIIPCLMADRNKFRLGYGGGFYDRFLSELSADCVKITVVMSRLLKDKLPVEYYDLPVDFVVTEKEIF